MSKLKSSSTALGLMIAAAIAISLIPGLVQGGSLEPSSGPGPTMKTLDEIPPTWSQKLPVAQRFVLVMDGAGVLDKETGLVWEKSPDTTARTWIDAVSYCYYKEVGGRKGWRLPSVQELASLVDLSRTNPTLPEGHPFLNIQSSYYWTSTTFEGDSANAWNVNMSNGIVGNSSKTAFNNFVWAVRGCK